MEELIFVNLGINDFRWLKYGVVQIVASNKKRIVRFNFKWNNKIVLKSKKN